MRSSLRICSLVAIFASLAFGAAPALAGNIGASGVALAFARVHLSDANDPTVVSFGGRGTKTATVGVSTGPGVIVLFAGRYPKTVSPDDVIVQATAEGGATAVANAVVVSATSSQLVVGVSAFTSTTGSAITQGDVFVTVFAGSPPD
ncbi:MAG TPA: hypothetical protein VEI82_06660 [Myxococcota bacterium]|nr:hypothetical protein [Myxococcota bacterium]